MSNDVNRKNYLDEHGLQLYDGLLKYHVTKVFYDTTANWDAQPDLITREGCIYIYSDWGEDPEGRKVAGFKVGDGETRLADSCFIDQMYADHINDTVRHITSQERTDWNNKVTCFYIKDLERLIFSH